MPELRKREIDKIAFRGFRSIARFSGPRQRRNAKWRLWRKLRVLSTRLRWTSTYIAGRSWSGIQRDYVTVRSRPRRPGYISPGCAECAVRDGENGSREFLDIISFVRRPAVFIDLDFHNSQFSAEPRRQVCRAGGHFCCPQKRHASK